MAIISLTIYLSSGRRYRRKTYTNAVTLQSLQLLEEEEEEEGRVERLRAEIKSVSSWMLKSSRLYRRDTVAGMTI